MARRWIRLDVTWEDSAWLDALSGEAAGCWPRLLCSVKRDGVGGRCKRPTPAVIARRWRVSVEAVEALEHAAIEDGALRIEDGDWIVCAWADYQERDPNAAERMRRYRAEKSSHSPLRRNRRNKPEQPVTDPNEGRNPSMSMSKDISIDQKTASSVQPKRRAHQLPADWEPSDSHRSLASERGVDLEHEATQFRDHATATGRTLKDWDAGFRMWLRKAYPSKNGANGNGKHTPQRITGDYLASVLLTAGSLVWHPETRDDALNRLAERYSDDEWETLVPYFLDMPWHEVVPAQGDKFLLREVLNRHVERHASAN